MWGPCEVMDDSFALSQLGYRIFFKLKVRVVAVISPCLFSLSFTSSLSRAFSRLRPSGWLALTRRREVQTRGGNIEQTKGHNIRHGGAIAYIRLVADANSHEERKQVLAVFSISRQPYFVSPGGAASHAIC